MDKDGYWNEDSKTYYSKTPPDFDPEKRLLKIIALTSSRESREYVKKIIIKVLAPGEEVSIEERHDMN